MTVSSEKAVYLLGLRFSVVKIVCLNDSGNIPLSLIIMTRMKIVQSSFLLIFMNDTVKNDSVKKKKLSVISVKLW